MPRRRVDPTAQAAQTVARTLTETKPGLDAHAERCFRFNRNYETWRSPDKPRPDHVESWEPMFRVKYGMQTVDQMTVSMAQSVPSPKCTPRNEASVDKAKAMEEILSYYTDMAKIAEKVDTVVQQALVYGVSPAKTRWLYKEADQRMLVPSVDRDSGRVIWQPGTQRVVECDRPDFLPWDAYDCWWEPTARDVDTAAYVILRCWPTKEELQRNEYNEDAGAGMYRNLELLFQSGPGEQRPVNAQNQLLDSQSQVYRDRFEVWEVWRNDRLTVIGNRQILLYDGPKPYWMPGKPITISHTRPDFFRIEGISELELVDHLQSWLQAQDNLRFENQRVTVQRPMTYRSTMPGKNRINVSPRGMIEVEDHDDLKPLAFDPLPPEAYQEHEVLLSLLQLVSGVNPYVSGATSSGTGADQTTATGVTLLTQAASKLLIFKAQQVANLTWARMYNQWADLTKQFLRSEIDVAVRGPGNETSWEKRGPGEVFGDYDVRIETAEESLNKQQRQTRVIALLNTMAPYAQSGLVNIQPLLLEAAEAFQFPNPQALIPAPQPQQPQAAPNGNNGGGYPTQPDPRLLGGQIAPHAEQSILAGNQR